MFFWRLKNCLKMAIAAIAVLLIFAILCGVHTTRFSAFEGERVFYLQSSSSQGLRKESLEYCDLFNVKGESVRFTFENKTPTQLLAKVLEEYNATVLFCECVAGILSYYAYTPQFVGGVVINGVTVNLHIAFRETTCVLGSPIIFDGY